MCIYIYMICFVKGPHLSTFWEAEARPQLFLRWPDAAHSPPHGFRLPPLLVAPMKAVQSPSWMMTGPPRDCIDWCAAVITCIREFEIAKQNLLCYYLPTGFVSWKFLAVQNTRGGRVRPESHQLSFKKFLEFVREARTNRSEPRDTWVR